MTKLEVADADATVAEGGVHRDPGAVDVHLSPHVETERPERFGVDQPDDDSRRDAQSSSECCQEDSVLGAVAAFAFRRFGRRGERLRVVRFFECVVEVSLGGNRFFPWRGRVFSRFFGHRDDNRIV